jgi:TnpA family transposase
LSESSRETQYEVNDGLQVVENWNSTNEFICYGRQGELATNSREQQEATTLSLQLFVGTENIIASDRQHPQF